MKKLLATAAVCGLVVASAPAHADIDLNIGGFMKGYLAFTDVDETAGTEARDFDLLRATELHFSGETTLDNGLTVGFHLETQADNTDTFNIEESYAYFSSGWGRINVGAEDGAAYLLQVAAPSADSNVDGIRTYIDPFNYGAASRTPGAGATGLGLETNTGAGFDYDQDVTAFADKLTYLSPILNGFQLGLTYVPDAADTSTESALNLDNQANALGEAYEASVRYEGNFDEVGFVVGAGYTNVELENNTTVGTNNVDDDRVVWNVGLDLDIGPFVIGAVYKEDDRGEINSSAEQETVVVGIDYTTGPLKLGASYYNQDNVNTVQNVELDRFTGGVTYTYGPGMSFRGSVSFSELDDAGTNPVDPENTAVLIGTDIKF